MKKNIKRYQIYYCKTCQKTAIYGEQDAINEFCKTCGNKLDFQYESKVDSKMALNNVKKKKDNIITGSYIHRQPNPTITCPYCQSTNTKKIGVVGRSMSFSLFGFGSSKVGKQWHCNNCKSDF